MTAEGLLGMEPGSLDILAPGVIGYTVQTDEALYIPIVIAMQPGNGDVSRYLDSLPLTETYRFPTVISSVLEGMLARRGFQLVREWDDVVSEWAQVWERRAVTSPPGSER